MLLPLILALSTVAATPPKRLAILPTIVEGQSGHTEVPRVFDELTRAASQRTGLELVDYNELFVDGAEPTASTVLACGSDMGCIARALRNARIELCLRAIINFGVSPPLVSLSLIEGPGERILGESVIEAETLVPVESELAKAASDLLESAKFHRGGTLIVALTPADARVTARECTTGQEHAPDNRSTSTFTLPAGCFELQGTRDAYSPAVARTEVKLGETTQLSLALSPAPGAEASIFSSPWFWVIAGGVVVAGSAAVLVATDPFGGDEPGAACYCVTTPQTMCPPCP